MTIRIVSFVMTLLITACATVANFPATNQPYLDAKTRVQNLNSDQYQYLDDKTIYIGDIDQDTPSGFGELISPDGSIYQGAIKNGRAHGFGKSTMITGEVYEGEHQQGTFEGKGKLTLSDGSFFIGIFKNHKVYRGEMHFTDGKVATL